MATCAAPHQKRRLFKDAGRACPVDYRIDARAFSGAADARCSVLYVVGGLYGNPFAFDALDDLVASEAGDPLVVLNGDMHWFDKTAENFEEIERRAQRYVPLVGNVEAELRRQEDVGVGCGCAYPDCTPDDAVSRSNRIHKMLSIAMSARPDLKELMQGRPATMVVDVAGYRVGITHGDEKFIGGWDCSRESLQDVMRQDEIDRFMEKSSLDVFATTHTCAPVALGLARGLVVNNGAAGLPNFAGQQYGLVVRIAAEPRQDALFEAQIGDLHVQAIPLRYDHEAFLAWFDELWDETSPASVSYRDRIVSGPADKPADALLGGFAAGPVARAESKAARDALEVRKRAGKRDVALALAKLLYFEDMLDGEEFMRTDGEPRTLQVNITARCNLACEHCHVESSPHRTESMSRDVLEAVLKVARDHGIDTIDVTGGAPEMHPDLAWFLEEAAGIVRRVMVRSNLVILTDPAYRHFVDTYDRLGVEVVASLPNVFAAQAEAQRGKRTFDASLEVMRELNERGYGKDGAHILDVVFNPQQPVLPPVQSDLEDMYRRRLGELGISFDNLFAVANNPIGRYGASLIDDGVFEPYLNMLIDSFNEEARAGMMCRHQVSVGWDGSIYDCDFNQALGLRAVGGSGATNIVDYAADPALPLSRDIAFGNHCYACTAGFGSSCTGTLVKSISE